YFVNTYGGSKKGEYAAMVGLIFGAFVLPPVGIIILPFITVLIVELFQQKTGQEALRSAIGSLIGVLSSMVVKVILQSMMIIMFMIYLIHVSKRWMTMEPLRVLTVAGSAAGGSAGMQTDLKMFQ